MARFGAAIAILLSTTNCQHVQSFHNFQPSSLSHLRERLVSRRRAERELQRNVAASSSNPAFADGSSSSSSNNNNNNSNEILGDAFSSVTNAARDSIVNAVRDEPDIDEAVIALKQQQVQSRTKTYTVTLPLTSSSIIEEKSQVLSMGLTLGQIKKGREFGVVELNLDTLKFLKSNSIKEEAGTERFDETSISRRVDGGFQGLVVSSVVQNGAAWASGVRPGDLLKSTSATIGSQRWPKSTLEGVRSVIQSRKAVSGSIQFEFQRLGEAVDNQFELTVTKPIGLELKETEDGYVEVTGFTHNAPTLVQYAVKVGDRLLAVDSSFGERMWPVSTVEGVISAVTSRLPGQQITFRFERPWSMMEAAGADEPVTLALRKAASPVSPVVVQPAIEQEELLKRCRDVITRYSIAGEPTKDEFSNKYKLPGLVADKVVDALASAGATVDRVTLSMIMGAYLSCRQSQKAIEVFEAVVGIHSNGSSTEPIVSVEGKNGMRLAVNVEALDIYTTSALLKAHAMNGDLSSVRRVLGAVGGRDESEIDGVKATAWPNTGPDGSLQPDTRCYNIAISALARSKADDSVDLAMQIFNGLNEPGSKNAGATEKNIVSYNAVINAMSAFGRYDEALNIFYQMKKAGLKPDKFTYTSLAKAVVAMSESDVDELFYDMREHGVSPDPILFNAVIKALCERRHISTAKKIVGLMESSGVSPDSMTYGLLMKGLMNNGNPSAALTLFETACSDQRTVALTENVFLYTTAISAAAAVADHSRALELLSRMNGMGISPNMKTMTALVGACLASKKPDLAFDIYKRITNPDGYAMTQGIRALCDFGQFKQAFTILRSEKSRVLSGKQIMLVYNSMIGSALERDDFDTAREVFSHILSTGKIPSKAIYQSIYDSLKLFPKSIGVLPPVVHFNEESNKKFKFLIFVLDSVLQRNLPCEGPLYSAILSYGSTLGGIPRKVAAMLVISKTMDTTKDNKIIDEGEDKAQSIVSSWEELLLRYDELKDDIAANPSALPSIAVRVNTRDIRMVLTAEKSISFAKRNPRQQEV